MSFCQIHWFSQILKKQTTTWVLLPNSGTPPFATFYLLHGLSDDQSIWLRRTRIEPYVADLPLIVVMPDGGRGFYTDHDNGPQYATHFGEELPSFIEQTFPAGRTRASRCIGGLSMGGYGALRIALGYPDRFASANSHSGALMFGSKTNDGSERVMNNPEHVLMFGENPRGTNHDLSHLAGKAKAAKNLPRLRIDCGTEDFLLASNRAMHRSLQEQKIEHEYAEFPGDHSWPYWDQHVQEAIAFHMQGFSNRPSKIAKKLDSRRSRKII